MNEYMALESVDIIDVVRMGVPALAIDDLARGMGVPSARLITWMGWPVAAIERKIRARSALSKAAGGQVFLLIQLISQIQQMVNESGNPDGFDAAAWLGNWLTELNPALGCVSPGEYMDTAAGFSLLSDTLARMQSGAYV
ncbi:antitoxin Xre/MbcA/ParS toxin-binding domain-containing protein [Castellaniella ginsengisoli]|uniref:Antitoxin Xre/MbcA/ParS toxin-binding domain-containing protein n=1 Tax=Castellaniella ginsengisoli TaxID=546114 RepID=A0AB39CIQ0_9BURK